MAKLRLRKLVDTEEAMNKFIVDYRIPPNVSLRHCKMGEWHYEREMGAVVIPVLAFPGRGRRKTKEIEPLARLHTCFQFNN